MSLSTLWGLALLPAAIGLVLIRSTRPVLSGRLVVRFRQAADVTGVVVLAALAAAVLVGSVILVVTPSSGLL